MRILYVLNALGGGASLGIYEMLRGIPRDRYTSFMVAPPGTSVEMDRVRPLFQDIRTFPIPSWSVDRHLDTLRRSAITLGQWRRRISVDRASDNIARAITDWKIDLVHTGTALSLSSALAARKTGKPHIWHIKECIGSIGRVSFPLADEELVSVISELSDRVVVMSEYIGRFFRSHGCRNLSVLADGVHLDPYLHGTSRNLRTRLGIANGELLVGMVASLCSTWKQHDVFVRMVGQLADKVPNARFVLIGPYPRAQRWPHDSPQRYFRGVMRLIEKLVPPGRLSVFDFVNDAPDIMRSLDVLVHPCSVEPFGRIAIEAMAAGTPVVGPRTGGIAETIVDGETGYLVAPRDSKSFADSTQMLLASPETRIRMAQAGRDRVRDRYSLAQHVEAQLAIYEGVVDKKEISSITKRKTVYSEAAVVGID